MKTNNNRVLFGVPPFPVAGKVQFICPQPKIGNDKVRLAFLSQIFYIERRQGGEANRGSEVYSFLEESSLLEKCLTLQALEVIKRMTSVEDITTHYFAWRSIIFENGIFKVPCLSRYNNALVIFWVWLGNGIPRDTPIFYF
ncbi:hypothetical protein AUJ77_02900 [Candidatus Nomurabacteria bacterium CG1_02_43_90]|uniref:Uncharacterized protein n=1 Tax=Candidatus Nomurabacteria bacterium CG1_02_43_90 TaxID=1805281 RepID=A0A1J4UZZ8_9BACT|nr:MAG: hypothetical protein AUJ77_02900 [Candidatus Nomurabacteria bacterium CG1_02_43_90]